jgi:hypothetical protein
MNGMHADEEDMDWIVVDERWLGASRRGGKADLKFEISDQEGRDPSRDR